MALETPREFWRPIINDFRPVGPVRPEDVSRFFVDRKEDDPDRSLVQGLKLSLQDSIGQPSPYKTLLTGHIGSGKSSELIRLGQELARDFFVVRFDAEYSLSPERANHFDVLLGMGVAVYKAANDAGLRPDKQAADNLVKSLAKFVRKYEGRKGFSLRIDQLMKQVVAIALGALGALSEPIAMAAGAATGAFDTTRLELNVRDDFIRTLELPPNRQEVIGALNEIIKGVQEKAKRPVLIMTDGLDKVPAARARLLFADSNLLTEPSCALVYAAPIEFYYRLIAVQATHLFDEYKLLPNPPVQKRPLIGDHWKIGRDPDEDSLKVMRKVVTKRLEARGKAVDEIITPKALDLLVMTSGGVMRELVRYFRDAARIARLRALLEIDEGIAQDAINRHRQEMEPRLDVDHREALRLVLQHGRLSGGQRESAEDNLLHNLFLLSYQDDSGNSWFDAHPNVLPAL
jgi:hypothetical protein